MATGRPAALPLHWIVLLIASQDPGESDTRDPARPPQLASTVVGQDTRKRPNLPTNTRGNKLAEAAAKGDLATVRALRWWRQDLLRKED